jgi:hypothetical protein
LIDPSIDQPSNPPAILPSSAMTATAALLNETHDPALSSWVESANAPGCDFTIQNLPHGVFRRQGTEEAFRGGVAIGDQVLDMKAAVAAGVFQGEAAKAAAQAAESSLNALMAAGPSAWVALRLAIDGLIAKGLIAEDPLPRKVAAISCGIVNGTPVLDLDYIEDSGADADANFVLIEGGHIAEAQATAEGATYDEEGLLRLLRLARIGCDRIFAAQAKAVEA